MCDAIIEYVAGAPGPDPQLHALRIALMVEDVLGEPLPDAALVPEVLGDPVQVDRLLRSP